MTVYDYKVIPAPTKGQKAAGLKTPEARFAHTVEGALNAQAAEGWEYLRTDILPSDERQGLTGSHTVYRTLMVFRRPKADMHSAADDVISEAQSVAETAAPAAGDKDDLTVAPTRADPAPAPTAPETPAPETPKKD